MNIDDETEAAELWDSPDLDEPPADETPADEWFDDDESFDPDTFESSTNGITFDDQPGADATDQARGHEHVAWYQRPWVAVQHRFDRIKAWFASPWPTERIQRVGLTAFSLFVTTFIMTRVVHLGFTPKGDLVFDNTTPTGGDFGAHVWGPAYLRDVLLPSGRLNGWSMDWYAGLPVYRFYMVVPAMMIVAVDTILPYGVAMKLVAVMGLVTLPAACWAFGRLANFRYPIPQLFAFAGLCFALDESFEIYGGNLKSTMAGEFSFSIAMSFAVLALGLLAAGLRTGKYRVWTSVMIALACVSHGIVMIYVVGAAVVFSLVWVDRERIRYILSVGVTSLLLMMWWVGPFLMNHSYMTDMKYAGEPGQGSFNSWWEMFFPLTAPLNILITTLAIIGFVACVVRRNLNGVALGVTGLVFVALVYLSRQSLPIIGLLWNPRVLPMVYLVRYLLMMVGAVELLLLIRNAFANRRAQEWAGTATLTSFAVAVSLVVLIIFGWVFQVLPFGGYRTVADGTTRYSWTRYITATPTKADAGGDQWAAYNFRGYEGRNEYYTEYYDIVQTMASLGADPQHGCGRATWENYGGDAQTGDQGNNAYGTPMALMLLPFWTDGCIGSMEGLYFEASGTTPYHFLSVAAISKQSSNPVRGLRYENNNAETGVRELRDLGVRYVMVRTSEAIAQAETQVAAGNLVPVASSQPWKVYEITGWSVVEPLAVQPVVINSRPGDQRENRLETGTSWFQQPAEWAAMPADDGPADWQRVNVVADVERNAESPSEVAIVVPAEPIQTVATQAAQVSNVEVQQQSLSFEVDQVGVPVLVKVSYFPNWSAEGAEGPYRVGPNMMVVVPTNTQVTLTYGRTFLDYFTMLLSLIGVGLCFVWRKQGDLHYSSDLPSFAAKTGSAADAGDSTGSHVAGSDGQNAANEMDQPLAWGDFSEPDDTTTGPTIEPSVGPPVETLERLDDGSDGDTSEPSF